MKTIISICFIVCGIMCRAQSHDINTLHIELAYNKTVHLIFDNKIKYVDLGSTDIIAGMADGAENVLRVKSVVKGFESETNFSVITSDGKFHSFTAVYNDDPLQLNFVISNQSSHQSDKNNESVVKFDQTGVANPRQVIEITSRIFEQNKRSIKTVGIKDGKLTGSIYGIYTHKDLIFIHTVLENKSPISFEIESIRFRIKNKKRLSRTASQETFIEPLNSYSNDNLITRNTPYRNVFVFDKFTLGKDFALQIEVIEKNGNRFISFPINSKDFNRTQIID